MIAPNFDLPTQKIRWIWHPVTWRLLGLAFAGIISSSASTAESKEADAKSAPKVSYYREIRPILQANCQGCHQPAKTKGGYMMTEFKRLLAGGDSEGAAIVPDHPEKSAILKMVTPQDGEVRMPKGKTPLMETEVALINSWIQQVAEDDTPADAKRHYDAEHPPIYSRPPVFMRCCCMTTGEQLWQAGSSDCPSEFNLCAFRPMANGWRLRVVILRGS